MTFSPSARVFGMNTFSEHPQNKQVILANMYVSVMILFIVLCSLVKLNVCLFLLIPCRHVVFQVDVGSAAIEEISIDYHFGVSMG